ncbi:MAG TPA: hypothetical protein VFL81_03095 [Candidatus Saccharimonadales bacterium]|nr:hypothetical protein [Candidatus Saccharimonadales bacterium]
MKEREDPAELEILLSKVHYFNQMMDMRQEAMLAVNALKVPKSPTEADFAAVAEQQRLLRAEYPQRTTMADKFALLLDERFTYMNSLDVAETSRPASHDELHRVKDEYWALLGRLIDSGVVKEEVPRSQDSRSIVFLDFEYDRNYARVNRTRRLIEFQDNHGNPMSLMKLMIFLMPRGYAANGKVTSEKKIQDIETKLDSRDPSIIPVRTIYYGKRENND